jgi:hypothetical protein
MHLLVMARNKRNRRGQRAPVQHHGGYFIYPLDPDNFTLTIQRLHALIHGKEATK